MSSESGAGREFSTRRSRRVRRSPEAVLAVIRDATSWAEWQPEISSTIGPASIVEGDVVEGEARMLGFAVQGLSRALEVGPEAFEEDVVVGVRMRIRFEVVADGDGARIEHSLTARMPGGFAGGLVTLFLRRRLKRMQKVALKRLVKRAEAG